MDKLTTQLKINYYSLYREWHYKDIEPRIFAEEMLDEGASNDGKRWESPLDYKIHVVCDTVTHIEVAADSFRKNKEVVMDTNWKELPFDLSNKLNYIPSKPNNFEQMLHIAIMLAKSFNYVRVDLYYVNKKIYIGELTFTPSGGIEKFNPFEWDRKLGDLWNTIEQGS